MSINTGQLTTQSRNTILTRINILTVIFTIFMHISLGYLDLYNELFATIMLTIFSYYLIYLGMELSRPGYRVVYEEGVGEEASQMRYVRAQGGNQVGIGEGLVKFCGKLVRNFKILGGLIVAEVAARRLFGFLLDILIKSQVKTAALIFKNVLKDIQQMQDAYAADPQLLFSKLMDDFQNLDQQLVTKLQSLTISIITMLVLNEILNFLFTYYKFIVMAQIERNEIAAEINPNGWISLRVCLSYLWYNIVSLTVIWAHIRLCLRLFWVFLLFTMFQPYYFICLAFMYRKITENQYRLWAINTELVKISRNKSEERLKQKQRQMDRQKQEGEIDPEQSKKEQEVIVQNVMISFHDERAIQIKKDNLQRAQKEPSLMFRKIQQKSPEQLEENVNTSQTMQKNIIEQYHNLKQKLQNKPKRQKQHQRQNRIRRFVYRHWHDDVIEVDRF